MLDPSVKSDVAAYVLAVIFGLAAGAAAVDVGDLLFTALLVLAGCMLLGALRPARPWRWVAVIGTLVLVVELGAYMVLARKPTRAQLYESFLSFLPCTAGAYGGSLLRQAVDNLLQEK
jgi:hypothetical protein